MHMARIHPCRIGVLRPVSTDLATRLRSSDDSEGEDPSQRIYLEHLEGIIERVRAMIDDAAAAVPLPIDMTEHQLFAMRDTGRIAGRKRARRIRQNDLLVTFDPSDAELAFMTTRIPHPLQRGLMVYSSIERRDEQLDELSSVSLPALHRGASQSASALRRLFPIHVPLNPSIESSPDCARFIRNALIYPHNEPAPRRY